MLKKVVSLIICITMVLSFGSVSFAAEATEAASSATRIVGVIKAESSATPATDVAAKASLAGISKVRWEGDLVYVTVNLYAPSAVIAVLYTGGTAGFTAYSSGTYPVWIGSSVNKIYIYVETDSGGSALAGTWTRP